MSADELQRRPSHWGETQEAHVDVQASEAAYRDWANAESADPRQHHERSASEQKQPVGPCDSETTTVVAEDQQLPHEKSYLGTTLRRRQTLWRRGERTFLFAVAPPLQLVHIADPNTPFNSF